MAESKGEDARRYQKVLLWDICHMKESALTPSEGDMNDLYEAFARGPRAGSTRDDVKKKIMQMANSGADQHRPRRMKLADAVDAALADLLKKGYIE